MDSLPYFSDSDAGDQVSGVPQWGFELLSGAGVGHAEIRAAIDGLQREIARIMGVEHLMMGDIGGNRSLAEDKSRNLYLIANSVLKYVASTVKSDIVVPIFKLNGFPMDKMPSVETEDVTFKNADAVTGALQRMASAGAPLTPNDPVINDIRELLGVSPVPDDIMAQGAMPQNPALAGMPPELQFGGAKKPGVPAVGSPIGPKGAAGQPRQPGNGGGENPFAGKSFTKLPTLRQPEEEVPGIFNDELEQPPAQEPVAPTRNGMLPTGVKPLQQGVPNGQLPADPGNVDPNAGRVDMEGYTPQGAQQQDAAAQAPMLEPGQEAPGIDIKGSSGKVEVDSGLLVRLLERFAGGPAVQAAAAQEAGVAGTPEGKPAMGEGLPPEAGQGSDPAAAQLGGDQPQPEGAEGAAAEGALAGAGGTGKPGIVAAQGAGKAPVPGKGPPGAAGQLVGKPTAAGAKPGAPGQPKPGDPAQQPPGAPGETPQVGPDGKPLPPGAPGAPQLGPDGKPLLGPDGQPLPPGMPPPPKEEMDIEQAVEILQPYADGPPTATGLDQSESRTESDSLYERLGQEKDVQALVTDQNAGDVAADKERVARGGEPAAAMEGIEDAEVALPIDPDAATGAKPPLGAGERPVPGKLPGSGAPAGIKPKATGFKPLAGKPEPNGKTPLAKPGIVEPDLRKPIKGPVRRVRL